MIFIILFKLNLRQKNLKRRKLVFSKNQKFPNSASFKRVRTIIFRRRIKYRYVFNTWWGLFWIKSSGICKKKSSNSLHSCIIRKNYFYKGNHLSVNLTVKTDDETRSARNIRRVSGRETSTSPRKHRVLTNVRLEASREKCVSRNSTARPR